MELSYFQKIRIFHIVIGLTLLYGVRQHYHKKVPPKFWWTLIALLAGGAIVYHGYKLYESYQ